MRGNDDGIALAMAITGALIVSITAAALLNFTYRRFQLSMKQAERMAAFYASEAGKRYADVRLRDTVFVAAVKADTTPPLAPLYILSSFASDPGGDTADQKASAAGHLNPGETIDVSNVAELRMGNKNVTVKITFDPGGRHQIDAVSDYAR